MTAILMLYLLSHGTVTILTAQQSAPDQADTSQLAQFQYFYQNGQYADAKQLGHEILKIDSTDQKTLLQLASIYDQEYNLPKAIRYYKQLLSTDTLNAYYQKQNALVHKKAGFKTDAFWYFAKAYELNSKDVTVVSELVDLLLENNQVKVADSILDESLKLDSTNIKLVLTKARSKYKQKDYLTVTKTIEQLFGRLDLPEFYTKMLGFSYLQIDSTDKAIYHLEQLIHSDQKEYIHYYLAIAYGKNENEEASLFHYEHALDKSISDNINIYYSEAAKIFEKQGKKGKAIQYYKKAYEYEPRSLYIYQIATLSDLYYKDKSIATRYYDQYAQMKNTKSSFADYARKRSKYLKEKMHQSNGR